MRAPSRARPSLGARLKTRLANELLYAAAIKDRAEEIWGWSTPVGRMRAARRARLFRGLTGMKAGDRVLEIGCGTGFFTQLLSATGAEIVAIDLSREMVDRARAKGIARCRFEVRDAHDLGFEGASFDIVYGSSALHHLEPALALEEMRRVLKPGGRLVFGEPNMMNPHIMLQKNVAWIKEMTHESRDETAFFRWPLARLLSGVGFVDVRVRPHDFLYPLLPAGLLRVLEDPLQVLERIPLVREFGGSLLVFARKP